MNKRRRLISVPVVFDLRDDIVGLKVHAKQALSRRTSDITPSVDKYLRHELAAFLVPRVQSRGRFETALERDYVNLAVTFLRRSSGLDGDGVSEALEGLCRQITGIANPVRSGDITTVPDERGGRVTFPQAEDWHRQASSISECLQRFDCAIIRATAVMALILNSHPFLDGNGRVSRAVFNAILRGEFPDAPFVWFTEPGQTFDRSFLINLRVLELSDDWNGLIGFTSALILHSCSPSTTGYRKHV